MPRSRNQAQFSFYGRSLLTFAIVCCVAPTDAATVLTGMFYISPSLTAMLGCYMALVHVPRLQGSR